MITLPEKFKNASISLEGLGLQEVAWNKTTTLEVINFLAGRYIGILGGDVYLVTQDDIELLPDSWCCQKLKNETDSVFFSRTIQESLSYISSFPSSEAETIIFTLVTTEPIALNDDTK